MKIVNQIKETLNSITAFDATEEKHLHFTKEWIDSGAGIFRLSKPATPDPHLVAYFLLLDPMQQTVLLVDHKKAGLWLPPGGHVEPNEHPKETVKRELMEELGVQAVFRLRDPFFLTVTKTAGPTTEQHTDVSVWYLLDGSVNTPYRFDEGEFSEIRWFPPTDIPYASSDPHMQRCIKKLKALNLIL